jgi:hypothetical protein
MINKLYNYNLLELFVSKYNKILKTLPKFKNCITNNDFINKLWITNNDFKLILKYYKLITIKSNTLLFSSQSIISRKQKFNKIHKNNFFELTDKVYSTQSFTNIENIHLSFSTSYFGLYNANGGRLIIYKPTKNIKILNIGNSLKSRIKFTSFLTKIIFGTLDISLFKNEKNKNFFCYKISCKCGTIGEPLLNLILLQYFTFTNKNINGLYLYDSTFNKNNKLIIGQEYRLFNISTKIKITGIIIDNTLFLNKNHYIDYIDYLIKLFNF